MGERQRLICATLASVADEFRTEVAKDATLPATSAPAWAPAHVCTRDADALAPHWDAYQRRRSAAAAAPAPPPPEAAPETAGAAAAGEEKKKKKKKGRR